MFYSVCRWTRINYFALPHSSQSAVSDSAVYVVPGEKCYSLDPGSVVKIDQSSLQQIAPAAPVLGRCGTGRGGVWRGEGRGEGGRGMRGAGDAKIATCSNNTFCFEEDEYILYMST